MKKFTFLLLIFPLIAFSQQQATNNNIIIEDYSSYFQQAYQLHPTIPKGILEAVAYTNTRIHNVTHNPGDAESCMGLPQAFGVMGLILDGKSYFKNNLIQISNLSGITINAIMNDPEQNILAYASALESTMNLVSNQRSASAKDIDIISGALATLSELPQQDEGQVFALNTQLYSFFTFMNNSDFQAKYNFNYNADLQTLFGEENYKVLSSSLVTVSDNDVSDGNGHTFRSGSTSGGISTMSADYAPAIWNAAASCNFSSRTQSVSAVVIHDVEGSYSSCISWFKNCSANVSAHYVVRSSDGQITQMVLESKKAWHVGSENGYTIGIEHEGFQAQTGWYTTAMYTASANLVKDICNSGYGILPTTCWHGVSCNGSCVLSSSYKIKGHQHYPNQTHDDPGPNWNWSLYYNLINGTTSCGTPSGLSANAITSTGATLNWSTVVGATSYNVQYKPASSSTWIATSSTTTSKSISGLSASTAYQFQVQAVCSSTGTFSSSATFTTTAVALTNDNCTNAQVLTPNASCVSTSGTLAGATASGLAKASCDAFSGTPQLFDVWYKFQATSTSHSIIVSPSASMDAVVALYTSCTSGQIGCSDNGGGNGASETITSTSLIVGTTYYVRVYSYGSATPATTTFNICVTTPTVATGSTITVGTGTSPYSAHPFSTVYMDERTEYIITQAELVAAGWNSSTSFLKSIAFNVTSAAAQSMNSFTITMAHTTSATFANTTFLAGTNATTVYSGTVTAAAGWNTYNFSTPFAYDGTSNLLITICWNNGSFTSNSAVEAFSYPDYMALYYRADVASGGVCGQATGTQSFYRPNAKLTFSSAPMANSSGNGDLRSMETASSLNMANESALEIFPNPLDGTTLYGKLADTENKNMLVKIYDMVGREVFAKEVFVDAGNFSLSFSDALKPGMYMLVGVTNANRFSQRILVK